MGARVGALVLAAVLAASWSGTLIAKDRTAPPEEPAASKWQREFQLSGRTLVPTERNPYFILEPGYRLEFEGKQAKLVITVLDDTIDVGGVVTRVVEEREWEGGRLVEVSRNYFAIDGDSKDVFYFGEDVDEYGHGKVTGHGGSWRAGRADARPGLMMPGKPGVGMKYFQEIAPGVAMDRAEVISLTERLETPAGTFERCLRTKEGSALNPLDKEYKVYAPDVGLIQDGGLLLVKHGFLEDRSGGEVR